MKLKVVNPPYKKILIQVKRGANSWEVVAEIKPPALIRAVKSDKNETTMEVIGEIII